MILRILALLSLIGTAAIAASVIADSTMGDEKPLVVAGVVAAGVLNTCLLAAVGFALEVLVDSYRLLVDIRINTEVSADFASSPLESLDDDGE